MEVTKAIIENRIAELEAAVFARRAAVDQALGALAECRAILAFIESPVEAIKEGDEQKTTLTP